MAAQSTDEELMVAYVEHGDASAFAELYRRYESRLFGFFVKRLLPSLRDSAADLFQKTWLKVHLSRHQYLASKRFAPWLFSVALNTFRDELRWLGPREIETADPHESANATNEENAEALLFRKEDASRIELALSELSGPDREAVILSEWEGFTPDELSELWQVSNTAARQRVSRARKRIRAILTLKAGTSKNG